ncbi:carbohydrate kinase family protein [Halalkalirubrum salinum]|uniref:carbohydrate kinase family protein n=1 Tax=Halalkalirubrum salinum TaxID=2563889 RepID=UPI0010FB0B19|nr:carbohydrate kinase [Halalkalirubrum salinum]
MHEILIAGETLIDFLPGERGELKAVETFRKRPGGAPANVAVGLSRLERTPAFWTRVGEDPFGNFLVDTLLTEGLPEAYIDRDPTAKTGLAFVSLGEDAEREFSFHRHESADTRLSPETIDNSLLNGRDWVHLGGVTLADEPARSATFELAALAADRGSTVSFDPNARAELWTEFDFGSSVTQILEAVDVLKITPEDLAAMGDDRGDVRDAPESAARSLLTAHTGLHTVCLTLGSAGAVAASTPEAPWNKTQETIVVTHAGYTVDPVDTTGAGDAFTAGLIDALSRQTALETALARANAVAALTTTAQGAMTALPTRTALSDAIDDLPASSSRSYDG